MTNKKFILLALSIFMLGSLFRLVGVNWDQSQHLHPDERFLTMVTQAIDWPKSFAEYLDTDNSPLNPHNRSFDFYVYGHFPVFLVKYISTFAGLGDYSGITIVGRFTSAIFDLGTLLVIILLSLRITTNKHIALLSGFFYAISVLPIQLAHFYATDSFLVFFLTLSFYALLSSRPLMVAISGMAFGLALSSKISAVLFVPVVAFVFLFKLLHTRKHLNTLLLGLVFVATSYLSVRTFDPYLFSGHSLLSFYPNPKFIANIHQLTALNDPTGSFPPGVQWMHAPSVIFPLENILLWGLGIPLGLLSLFGLVHILKKSRHSRIYFLVVINVTTVFLYQATQFAMPLRYFSPMFPGLCIAASVFLYYAFSNKPKLFWSTLVISAFWPIAFIGIYFVPHSRVAASMWINTHIPPGSTLSCDYWDDCLPLRLPNSPDYITSELHLYDPESSQKWDSINLQLSHIDYLILSSNRLYGSIMSAPEKYPQTTEFYEKLFAGNLGFTKIAEFTSRPKIPLPFNLSFCATPPFIKYGKVAFADQECGPGLNFVDDYADESFTVYDHPKVIIFKRIQSPSR